MGRSLPVRVRRAARLHGTRNRLFRCDGVQAGFVEVEFVFEVAKDLIAYEAFVAEADGGFALNLNQLAP